MQMLDGHFDGCEFGRFIAPRSSLSYHLVRFPARDVEVRNPVRGAERYPINGYKLGFGCIPKLDRWGGPTAVARLVIAIVIFAVERVTRRGSRPHIIQKILKTIQPSLAYGDASATISVIFWVVGVRAAILHLGPDAPLHGIAFAVEMLAGQPIIANDPSRSLASQASATEFSFPKTIGDGQGDAAAITHALPHGAVRAGSNNPLFSNQPSKSLPRNLQRFRHINPLKFNDTKEDKDTRGVSQW